MSLAKRLAMLARLRDYMLGNDPQWEAAKEKAYRHNSWFIPSFIDLAVEHITAFLEPSQLERWLSKYSLPDKQVSPKTIGLVLPGNIPLEGFYDFASVYLSGHRLRIKLSAKDDVLLRHLVNHAMQSWDPTVAGHISFEDMLRGCDAYLATDTGPLAQYLNKYPALLRAPFRSAAVITGNETAEDLELLADDVFQYFGQGCLNVNKLYVPRHFDFIPLLKAFEKYRFLIDHNKYKNNYDYQLALLILNKEFYMTNGCILLTEEASKPSPVARLNYEYYDGKPDVLKVNQPHVSGNTLKGKDYGALGTAGQSVVCGHINGMDTLKFLLDL